MAQDQATENIIDASRPNAGRIYDYWLGGFHNFEIDRQAAEQVKKMLPSVPKLARMQRWCLQDLAIELTEKRGFKVIIDFASGLPTEDHIHLVVPAGTTVIYSDYDPVTCEYAHDILGNTPNVYYFESDARYPEKLLSQPGVEKILQGRRDVALVHWGVSSFMKSEEIAHAAQVLYQWSGPRSCWAFEAQGIINPAESAKWDEIRELYARSGSKVYFRALEEFPKLIPPWRFADRGFASLLEWHGFGQTEITEAELGLLGVGGGGYGAYLIK